MSLPRVVLASNNTTNSEFATARTTQLHAENAFHLRQNLRMRNGLAAFILLDDRRLLVDANSQVLLRHTLGLTGLTNNLTHRGRHPTRRRHIIFTVQLGNTLVIRALVTFIVTRRRCRSCKPTRPMQKDKVCLVNVHTLTVIRSHSTDLLGPL